MPAEIDLAALVASSPGAASLILCGWMLLKQIPDERDRREKNHEMFIESMKESAGDCHGHVTELVKKFQVEIAAEREQTFYYRDKLFSLLDNQRNKQDSPKIP